VTVPQGIERLSAWLRQTRQPARVPVVVPEPAHAGGAAGFKALQPVKACPNAITLPAPEARSKRLWKAASVAAAPLPGKIIKFP
jgi:hypothetical protein